MRAYREAELTVRFRDGGPDAQVKIDCERGVICITTFDRRNIPRPSKIIFAENDVRYKLPYKPVVHAERGERLTETLRRAGVIEQGEAGLEDLAVEYRRTAAQISIKIRECREAGIDTGHLGAMRRDLREAAAVLTRYYDYPRFGVGIWEPKHKHGKR